MSKNSSTVYHRIFIGVLEQEARSIANTLKKIEPSSIEALVEIYAQVVKSDSKLIFSGIGKSGIIAKKIASTFTSLGLSSIFLHPVEALHGDLGHVSESDAIVVLSKSGTTQEILHLLQFLNKKKLSTIGLLGNVKSTIGKYCDVILDCSVDKEACCNNQAPTTSTTVTLALGDAMAVVFQHYTSLTREKFAINHPGGFLGKSLSLRVKHLLIPADECAVAGISNTLKEVIVQMTERPQGICCILDDSKKRLLGIIVDGDLKRLLYEGTISLEDRIEAFINRRPITIDGDELAFNAIKLMESRKKISVLPVLNHQKEFTGVLRLHDIIREGLSVEKKSEYKKKKKDSYAKEVTV